MPASSVVSVGSSAASSVGSAGSRRSCGKYRTVSRTSAVDEVLFGTPKRTTSAPTSERVVISPGRRPSGDHKKPEIIQVVTKDMIRKLRVPNEDPSGQTLIMSFDQFSRIRNSAQILTKKEREAITEKIKSEKKEVENAVVHRKDFMQQMEQKKKQKEKLSDLEQEAKEKSQYLLQKAQEQLEEQEDEIKKLNESILNAKCHAIRDAQILEKTEIQKEVLEEEMRLDTLMENERVLSVKEYEETENAKRLERLNGAKILHNQIEENEQQKLLEQEKKDQETIAMLGYLEKLKEEDLDSLQKKKDVQRSVMRDVASANNEVRRIKEQQKSREILEEKKVMKYITEKAARAEAYEKEKEQQRIEREKEIARLRAQQEKAKDKVAEKHALQAKRNQEEVERDWRRKEKLDAEMKAEVENKLREARLDQITNKEHFLAVQAGHERAEFHRVLKAQRESVKRDEEADKAAHSKKMIYGEDVRMQIKEKEKLLVQGQKQFFEEGVKLDQEAKERRAKLDEIKQRKLKELKEVGVSDKYVNEVARRVVAPPPFLSN